jgi:tetratricopeptide (TPR) repeat protein
MLGDYDAACQQFEQARALFARIGQRSNEAITLVNLAIARLNQQRPADAQAQARQALQMLRASGDRWGEGAALRVIGQAALALQDGAAAVAHLQASAELFDSLGLRHLALEAMAGLASAALAAGDLEQARAHTEAVLARQAEGLSLEGTEEPMRIHLSCYRVLAASADARAAPLLAAAHGALIERAERIGDAARRAVYLQAVPHHRELVAAWAAGAGGPVA